jgi:hypothetical protein
MSDVLELWTEALVNAVSSLQHGIFALFDANVRVLEGPVPPLLPGAWVSYVGDRIAVDFALLGEEATLVGLTGAFTGTPDPSELAVTDAVVEIANILGGLAKRRLARLDPTLRTGLPKFLFGAAVRIPRSRESILEVGTVAGPVVLAAMVARDTNLVLEEARG